MDNSIAMAFSIKEYQQASLWKNLFGVKPRINAIIAINNLLASHDLSCISIDDIQKIASQYHVNLRKEFLPELFNIYRDFLRFCLNDKYLADQEVRELKCLKDALSLTDAEVGKIHQEVTGELYKMEVEKAIEDGRLSEDEKYFLKEIQSNLKLSDSLAKKIYHESANVLLSQFMDTALSDKLLTEEEEQELKAITKSLNIDMSLEGSSRANFEKCKLFWQIENGKLPVVEADMEFEHNESCHFYTNAEWLEQKISMKCRDKAAMHMKIAKGLHWKNNLKEVKPELEDIWATMDNGKIYLTNTRICLSGNEGEKEILLSQIMDFTPYANGINVLEKKRSIFIQFKDHVDIFSIILGKVISNL